MNFVKMVKKMNKQLKKEEAKTEKLMRKFDELNAKVWALNDKTQTVYKREFETTTYH